MREFLTQVFGIVFRVIDNDYQYEIITMNGGRLEIKEGFRYRCFHLIQVFFAFVFVTSLVSRGLLAQQPDSSPRLLVHLLEYLAADYSGAVKNQKVINRSEYEEQLEFGESSVRIAKDLAADSAYVSIVGKTEKLQRLIAEKADGVDVANLARAIKQEVLSISQLSISPAIWPNLKNGEHLFSAACANCHGSSGRGDGPGGRGLDPAPRNLLDNMYMKGLPPFHAFNVIRLGIPGTSMVSHPEFSDKEVWDLAFFVLSMRHQGKISDEASLAEMESWDEKIGLSTVASLSDEALLEKLEGKSEDEKNQILAFLRTKTYDGNDSGSLQLSQLRLVDAQKKYDEGDYVLARSLALSAYLDGFEPVEPKLRSINPEFVSEIEYDFAEVRKVIERRDPALVLKEKVGRAQVQIARAESLLRKQDSSFATVFWLAAGIIFREGFEAVLIILAMLGVIRAVRATGARRFIHGGWASALGVGILAWFFTGWMVVMTGARRELTEAVGALFAVVMLLYVGFWLHSKTEIKRWTKFIDGRVRSNLNGGSRWGLFLLAFVAVFREALESVLFLRALTIDGVQESSSAMALGVFVSFLVIFALAWVFLKYSVNIPVRKLFALSSWLMLILSVMLLGKGLRALQEVGMVPMSFVKLPFELSSLGIFPTAETLMSQLCLVVLSVGLWTYLRKDSAKLPKSC